MTPLDQQMFLFSAVFSALIAAYLVIPIVLRKRDVFTAWSCFLLGSLMFTGLSGINSTLEPHFLPSYTAGDYLKFYAGVIVFYAAIIATYHFIKQDD